MNSETVASVGADVGVMEAKMPEMPESVLDGRLGEIFDTRLRGRFPLDYAWPALLTVASVQVAPDAANPTNLYATLIGPKGSGKSQAIRWAQYLLDLRPSQTLETLCGSIEQLAKEIDALGADQVLYSVDELNHVTSKGSIEGATLFPVLCRLFNEPRLALRMRGGDRVDRTCFLSIAGGIVSDRFDNAFGAAASGGFADRFLFGICPEGFQYDWSPFEGGAASGADLVPTPPSVPRETHEARNAWRREKGLGREAEIAFRCSLISAAYSGKEILTPDDLGPCFALGEYLGVAKKRFAPNLGENSDGVLAEKLRRFLGSLEGEGWVPYSDLVKRSGAYRFGPRQARAVFTGLVEDGEFETLSIPTTQRGGRPGQKVRLARPL